MLKSPARVHLRGGAGRRFSAPHSRRPRAPAGVAPAKARAGRQQSVYDGRERVGHLLLRGRQSSWTKGKATQDLPALQGTPKNRLFRIARQMLQNVLLTLVGCLADSIACYSHIARTKPPPHLIRTCYCCCFDRLSSLRSAKSLGRSPSDWRAPKNTRSDIRRALRADGELRVALLRVLAASTFVQGQTASCVSNRRIIAAREFRSLQPLKLVSGTWNSAHTGANKFRRSSFSVALRSWATTAAITSLRNYQSASRCPRNCKSIIATSARVASSSATIARSARAAPTGLAGAPRRRRKPWKWRARK